MEKDLLQSIKIEISKSFRLVPYERIAFHKLLGIMKTANGTRILLRELYKEPLIRESAVSVLKDFNDREVTQALYDLMKRGASHGEMMNILGHLERFGSGENVPAAMEFIEAQKNNPDALPLVARAMNLLRVIGGNSAEVLEFLKSFAMNKGVEEKTRGYAIVALSAFRDISLFESLLREQKDAISFAAYTALTLLSEQLDVRPDEDAEDPLFTYSPDSEDRNILNIRVLLGKATTLFDGYSGRTKAAFIRAMIACHHREFIIYAMKALTAGDPKLTDMILYLVLAKVDRLRDPDKLFRNLIALSVDTERNNGMIVEIFERSFTRMKESRKNLLLRDKLYNYIVVTLETYFETYRKDFMISDVIEKDYPGNFQKIRRFMLENFNPGIKKRVVAYLRQEDRSRIHKVLGDIAEKISFVGTGDREALTLLIEVLFDGDKKSRETGAARIEDVNFEKLYLRNRIVRLCEIIGLLHIDNAATSLVKIFNYVKKYPDPDIFHSVASALSALNYPYMLGELEVLLTSGDEADQRMAVQLLAQFTDQRSLNILLDFLKEKTGRDHDLIRTILEILLRRDIAGNTTASQILKKTIASNPSQENRRLAILGVGKCAGDADLEYLNNLFYSMGEREPREAIVQAIGYIINLAPDFNKRQAIKYLQEYLKDPGIKVRIYSCSLLILLGNKEALKSIRDMMIIKNKNIQREILLTLGKLRSVEFAYFLISLLKEEYAISQDIIPVLRLLPEEELKEIDTFIINIFKKYEGTELDITERPPVAAAEDKSKTMKNLEQADITLLNIEIPAFHPQGRLTEIEFIRLEKIIQDIAIAGIIGNKGGISLTGEGRIMAFFRDPVSASTAALNLSLELRAFNRISRVSSRANASMHIIAERVKMVNDEIITLPEFRIDQLRSLPFRRRIYLDEKTRAAVENHFYAEPVPAIVFPYNGSDPDYQEMICPLNFLTIAESAISELTRTEQEKVNRQVQLEMESKRKRIEQRSPTAVAYARALDEVGRILKGELGEINKYVEKRSTDRELIRQVDKMLGDAYKRFVIEASRIIIE